MNTITRRSFIQCISLGVAGMGFDFVWPHPTEAEVPWLKIMSIVSGIGTAARTTKDVADAIQAVKGILPQAGAVPQIPPSGISPIHMQQFQPKVQDSYEGGRQWLPGLQNVAAQHGNSWVPSRTEGFLGINLTGIWSPPLNLNDQMYVRQFGPYLNVIAGLGGIPTLLGEGLFDPKNNIIHILGQGITGAPVEVRAKLSSNWTLYGVGTTLGQFGELVQLQMILIKIA